MSSFTWPLTEKEIDLRNCGSTFLLQFRAINVATNHLFISFTWVFVRGELCTIGYFSYFPKIIHNSWLLSTAIIPQEKEHKGKKTKHRLSHCKENTSADTIKLILVDDDYHVLWWKFCQLTTSNWNKLILTSFYRLPWFRKGHMMSISCKKCLHVYIKKSY